MTVFFEYPKAASFGRVLPKSKIYAHASAGAKLKQLFVDQVDQIIWQYKLAPETINLSATKSVSEIQVFKINLRTSEISEEVLRAIDKAIPFPIIFELTHAGKRKAIAAYKRPSEADSTKWVVSEYFGTNWEAEDNPRKPLPQALNLNSLYEALLQPMLPTTSESDEPIASRVLRMETIRAKQREAERIKARLAKEKQFNKRVEINAELRDVTNELKRLGGEVFAKK
jgi:hypothetical protein